jgi:hypothetical protein
LAAGLCIGGLIVANFAMLAVEEKEKEEVVVASFATAGWQGFVSICRAGCQS